MIRKITLAQTISLATTFAFTLLAAAGSVAAAKPALYHVVEVAPRNSDATQSPASQFPGNADAAVLQFDPAVSARSLSELVARQNISAPLSRELNCLAGAIYFESKSEPLAGQLAVGRVVVARARSGRFADSYCGVVYQPSQFSFVRGSAMPAIPRDSRGWKTAVAVAQIAHDGSWASPVEGALYFHSARIAPRWRVARMTQVGNHVFYR